MNNLDFKNDLLTKQITKLSEEALKPMSILEIKEKFNLSFPFKVKRVKDSNLSPHIPQLFPVGNVFTIYKIAKNISNANNQANEPIKNPFDSTNNIWQSADVQDYILFEEN